eukprot:GHVH01006396.1.p1 GENE.GHVH01006396.1~~GHVH01006396.1.p1  ORF type:complete len:434 (-),score=91.94 GHVH01006396.1:696-1997(-)
MKKVYRGDDEAVKKFWMSSLKQIDAGHTFEQATEIGCVKVASKNSHQKSLRGILKNQKSGSFGRFDDQSTYNLDVCFVTSGADECEKQRSYTGAILPCVDMNQFVLLDHDQYYTAHPIGHLVNFVLKITADGLSGRAPPALMIAATTGDSARLEKEHLNFINKELNLDKHAMRIMRSANSLRLEDEDLGKGQNKKKTAVAQEPVPIIATLTGKNNVKGRKGTKVSMEGSDWGNSALNVGSVRKDDADWDFEEGSVATDDEGDGGGGGDEDDDRAADVDQFVGTEVSDSSAKGSSEEELDETGQNIKDAMDKAEIRAADAELEQFSEDEEEVEEGAEKAKVSGLDKGVKIQPLQHAISKEDPLKTRIVGALHRNGNSMLTKEFMARFVRTKDTKDPNFIAIHKCIRELCEVKKKKDPSTGVLSNYIQLKPDYRN